MPSSSVINDKQQLSFIYQPGIGLYDKKVAGTITTPDDDKRRLSLELSLDDSSSSSSDSKPNNSHKSCLTRQNEPESLPILRKQSSSNELFVDKNKSNSSNYPIKSFDINISSNQENHQKRKLNQNICSNKKLRHTSSSIKSQPWSKEQEQIDSHSKVGSSTDENFKCQRAVSDEKLERKLLNLEPQRNKRLRSTSTEHLQKQSITKMIKSSALVKKSSVENAKPEAVPSEKEIPSIPSQGLLLCPKEDPTKKKKKKKIAATIVSSTELLDDDPVLDSILFNEMQSVQQQWQQFTILTMEKELHINPSDAYENLYDFEGMKHWYPTAK